jgi:hypothetical protein
MKINEKKTKEMVIHFKKTPIELDPITINGVEVDRVQNFKILGVWVSENLTWDYHVNKLTSRMSQRMYFLKQLRRSGAHTEDLLTYYKAVIRSIAEYACQVWHSGLTAHQANSIEKQQERALKIILPGMNYTHALAESGLSSLQERRHKLCMNFFSSMTSPSHKLHHLLPSRKSHNYNTRTAHQFVIPKISNNRFKREFITNALLNYQ